MKKTRSNKAAPVEAAPTPPPPGVLRRPLALLLAVVSGVMVFMSFPFSTVPDSNLWPLGWVALVPFLFVLHGRRPKAAFWYGFLTGLVTNFGGFWWISEVLRDFGYLPPYITWPLTALNAAYQGLVFAIAAAVLARRLRHGELCIWRFAAIFTVVEWLFPMLFPWFLGNGQYRFLPAIQIAELGGVPAVTFVMVVMNGAVYRLLAARVRREPIPWRPLAPGFALVAGAILYGVVRVAMVDAEVEAAEKMKLGLVEANIGIFEKEAKGQAPHEQRLTLHRNLLKHQHMSRELADAGADLVIWPESSYFPLIEPWMKRSDDFALMLTASGALAAGDPAGPAPSTRPLRVGGDGLLGLAAAREDAWIAYGAGGALVTAAHRVTLPDAPRVTGAALVARDDGRSPDRGTTALDAVVVGAAGYVARVPLETLAGGRVLAAPSPASLRAAAPIEGDAAVAVGEGGVAWRVDGGQITPEDAGVTADLVAIARHPTAPIVTAVGAAGTVVERNAGRWRVLPPPAATALHGVAYDADGLLWVSGDAGVFVRGGDGWHRAGEPLRALGADARGTVLGVDARGALVRRIGGPGQGGRFEPVDGAPEGVVAIAPLPYVQASAFPRDVRWVWQSRALLPRLEDFVARPSEELTRTAARDLSPVQRGFAAPILFGGLTWALPEGAPRRDLFNTAIMLDQHGRVVGTYDKVYLLAFGEYMPFGETFPELYDAFPNAGRFTPGDEVRVFEWRGHRIGVMVCYEDILATFTNRLARERPNIIINVTNDAWFGRTSEPHLHLALAVFRAVENRLVLVRSTNTGVSALIEPTGRIAAQTSIDDPETLLVDAALMPGGTPYSFLGHAFAWLVLAGLLLPPIVQALRRRLSRPSAPT